MTPLIRDLAERAAATFVQAFLGALLTAPALNLSRPALHAAALAGVAAVLSLVKGLAATRVGDPATASLTGSRSDG